jgi:hypothetical protein
MHALLAAFGTESAVSLNSRIEQRDEGAVYTPVALRSDQTTTTTIFNATIDFQAAATMTDEHMRIAGCGISFPFRFYNENWNSARLKLARSNYLGRSGINYSAVARTAASKVGTNVEPDTMLNRIDGFLNFTKDKEGTFLTYLFEQVDIFASMWKDKFNLSQVRKTGGLETTILCRLKLAERHITTGNPNTITQHLYADGRLGVTDPGDMEWYHNYFTQIKGVYRTTRAGILRAEELQAFAFATNSIPPILTSTRAHYLKGPFFARQEEEIQYFVYGNEEDSHGKLLWHSWNSKVFKKYFITKPQNITN